jgi:hypothetical protein
VKERFHLVLSLFHPFALSLFIFFLQKYTPDGGPQKKPSA